MISFIVPAHNEETLIRGTLETIASAARQTARPFELVVVDDDSSDRTAEIARACGASVVPARVRQIAAARNAGAAAATGDIFFFIDADTHPTPAALNQALDAIGAGAVAGGAFATLSPDAPRWAHRSWAPMQWLGYALKLPGGAFMFMTRDAFERAGRFDEQYFAGEEIYFARRLKKIGRFRMVRGPVITSGRKFRLLGFRGFMAQLLRLAVRGPRAARSREHLDLWYGKHRD